jgi:hypothetical protein
LQSNRFVTILNLGGVRVKALLDTGAACSVLNGNVFLKYAKTIHRSTVLEKGPILSTVNAQKIYPLGQTYVKIDQISRACPVVIVQSKDLHQEREMILGNDNLRSGKAIINLKTKTLTWFGKEFPLKEETNVNEICGFGEAISDVLIRLLNKF